MPAPVYRGRFAPSPTGLLHFGSLITAVASYADAHHHQGSWLLRIDDLDQGRCLQGMDSRIMYSLEAFGLYWDGQPTYQSASSATYQEALDRLITRHLAYVCTCSRRQIAQGARGTGLEGPLYPDTCRLAGHADAPGRAIRLLTDDRPITFTDRLQPPQTQQLHRQVGDFVIRRADGYFAYQLAVVVDDAQAGVNQVVRGADLLGSTARQIYLHRLLQLPLPQYLHLPLVLDEKGRKLSKRDLAHPIDESNPVPALLAAWRFLGQTLPEHTEQALDVGEFWRWAIPRWRVDRIPVRDSAPATVMGASGRACSN